MWCHPSLWLDELEQHTARERTARPSGERVGDAERERAAALVSRAYADGLLRADELDPRLEQVYAATTVGDLDAATHDLPVAWRRAVEEEERRTQRRMQQRASWRRSLQGYATVMVLLVAIWAVTAVTAGAWYPWPMWPALGWGIPLLLGARAWARRSPERSYTRSP